MNTGDADFAGGNRASTAGILPYIMPGAAEPVQNRFGDFGSWKLLVGHDPKDDEYLQKIFVSASNKVAPLKSEGVADVTALEE